MDNWHKFFKGWSVFRTCFIQETFIKTILKYTNKNSKMVELGAGSGLTSLILSYSGRNNIVVSDIDREVIKNIKDEFGDYSLTYDIIDMFNIHYDDKEFDVIYHQGVLEHFSDDMISKTLKEQARVARYIIFDIPNGRRELFSFIPHPFFKAEKEFGDERFLLVKKWKKLIKDSDLELVEYRGRRLSKIFKYLPFNLINNKYCNKWFGTSSIFVCKENNGKKI